MYLFFTCLILVLAHTESVKESGFNYIATDLPINTSNCKNACVSKCCPRTDVLINDKCTENTNGTDIKDLKVDVYTKDLEIVRENLSGFTFVHHAVFVNNSFALPIGRKRKAYILENGELLYRTLNYLNQWSDPIDYTGFCVEAQVGPGAVELVYKVLQDNTGIDYEAIKAQDRKDTISAIAMLVSCFFLLLVLVTYAVIPKKRILVILMRVAYISCQISAFIVIPIQIFARGELNKSQCIVMGLIGYYTFLASFSWLNVMSYDVWRNIGLPPPLSNTQLYEVLPEFFWYCLYGFGVPLLATLFLVGIDYVDLTSVPDFAQPHFVFGDPNSCYFETDDERRLYMNAPVLVLTVINIVFFIKTMLNIKGITMKSGGSGLSRNTKKDRSNGLLYLKLTLVMGINWILDVMGAFISPNSWFWFIPDIFNSLVGFSIFLIFICDKETLNLLRTRFWTRTKTRPSDLTLQTSVSKSTSQSSNKESGQTTVPEENLKKEKF